MFLATTMALANEDSQASTPDASFAEARAAAISGEYATAMNIYSVLVAQYPGNVDFVFGYAQVLFWTGKLDAAIALLERAREIAPGYEEVWMLEHRARLMRGDPASEEPFAAFRAEALQLFPGAIWLDARTDDARSAYEWTIRARQESLDNGLSDWQEYEFRFAYRPSIGSFLSASVTSAERFELTDTIFAVSGYRDFGPNWFGEMAVSVSDNSSFAPESAVSITAGRKFDRGWVTSGNLRRADYGIESVNVVGVLVERYLGKFRVAYGLSSAGSGSARAWTHRMAANVYAESGMGIGFTVSDGQDIEIIAPGQLEEIDVWSASLNLDVPIGNSLNLRLASQIIQQGNFYRRTAAEVALSGVF